MEQRVTLVRDATDEFPQNTNNSFKVRIPGRLSLPGPGWKVPLLSLTIPNGTHSVSGFDSSILQELIRYTFTTIEFSRVNKNKYTAIGSHSPGTLSVKTTSLKDIPMFNGVDVWKAVFLTMENDIRVKTDERHSARGTILGVIPFTVVPRTMRPAMKWDGEDFIVERSGDGSVLQHRGSVTVTRFLEFPLNVALQWGFIRAASGNSYVLGHNVEIEMDNSEITQHIPPRADDLIPAQFPDLTGKVYKSEQRLYHGSSSHDKQAAFRVYTDSNESYVQFSAFYAWRSKRLNASYRSVMGVTKQSVMVYSNLQQSTAVGSVKVQLLREVVVERNEEGHSHVEPTHLQWLPVSTNQMDIAEVQLADLNGQLLSFPTGKTMVTVAFKRDPVV